MKTLFLALSIFAISPVAQAQTWSAGLAIGSVTHHYSTPIKEKNQRSNSTSVNFLILVAKTWGRSEKWLTKVSFDYYKNTIANRPIIDVAFENKYYTGNISASYRLYRIPKLNWNHYLGPTFSLSFAYAKGIYSGAIPENYIEIKNPDRTCWLGLDYTGNIAINNRLSAIYNIGTSFNTSDMGDFRYLQFRYRGNAGISYKL